MVIVLFNINYGAIMQNQENFRSSITLHKTVINVAMKMTERQELITVRA